MNYLNLSPANNQGGHPVSLQDFLYLQNGIFDVLWAMTAKGYDDQGLAILQQVEITDNGTTFDHNGFWFIYMSLGFACFVPAATGVAKDPAGTSKYYLSVTTTSDPDNPVTYQSGQNKTVHQLTSASIVHTSSPGGNDILLSNFNFNQFRDNGTFTLSGVNTGVSGGHESFRYRTIDSNTLLVYISFKGDTTGDQIQITLPFPYALRSNSAQVIYCKDTLNAEYTAKAFTVADDDKIQIDRISGINWSSGTNIEVIGAYLTLEIKYKDA